MAKQTISHRVPPEPIYDAIVSFRAGAVYVRSTETTLVALDFVGPDFPGAARPGHWMIIDDAPPVLQTACAELRAYFAGQLHAFSVPIQIIKGTEFQRKVWEQLQKIPYGVTWSYEELAEKIIQPGQTAHQMARAVGSACAANPMPILIPCHRVIGKNGRLIGFTGGVDLKAYLLNHEMLGI